MIRRSLWVWGLVIFCLWGGQVEAGSEVRFARHPAPSPDGSQLVFGWRGDLWIVSIKGGQARRLTAHKAYDHSPVWSPDGKMIAFASRRFGNDDVYVMGVDGGQPRRLTFHSGHDRPIFWLPGSKRVVF